MGKSDCLGCAVLLCLVCLFDLACFFLSLSLKTCMYMYVRLYICWNSIDDVPNPQNGQTPLHKAAIAGHHWIVEVMLLCNAACIDYQDKVLCNVVFAIYRVVTCTHSHTHIITYSHTHILTHSHTHVLTYSHNHILTSSHTHTLTHTHTHTHTHTAPEHGPTSGQLTGLG